MSSTKKKITLKSKNLIKKRSVNAEKTMNTRDDLIKNKKDSITRKIKNEQKTVTKKSMKNKKCLRKEKCRTIEKNRTEKENMHQEINESSRKDNLRNQLNNNLKENKQNISTQVLKFPIKTSDHEHQLKQRLLFLLRNYNFTILPVRKSHETVQLRGKKEIQKIDRIIRERNGVNYEYKTKMERKKIAQKNMTGTGKKNRNNSLEKNINEMGKNDRDKVQKGIIGDSKSAECSKSAKKIRKLLIKKKQLIKN